MKRLVLSAGSGQCGLAQQMKRLGHLNPADQQKARLLPKLPQNLDEVATETVTIEELRATIGAGSDKLQLPGFETAPVGRHGDSSIRPWTGWKLAEAQSAALRQPAGFLKVLVPVAAEAGSRLAAHPDDAAMPTTRGTPTLVCEPYLYQSLLDIYPRRFNALQFCAGTVAEMNDGSD